MTKDDRQNGKTKTSLQELLFAKGVATGDQKELTALRQRVQELERQLADQADALFTRAVRCLKEENYIDAMGFLQAVHYLQPDNCKAINNLGLVYFELGFNRRAKEMFRQVLQLEPDNGPAKNNLEICD